ncbi:DUF3566 domain-containing protein [Nocardioides sp. GCM10027113]|uniref:DUF3566 domain-containing protein n=1 Tax=unclassified Nocardioides TaxID=2615069 RepID=UPI003612B1F5
MTERPAERTASRPRVESTPRPGKPDSTDDTAVRPPLAERIQAKLSKAADEHRANARAESKPATPKAAPQKSAPKGVPASAPAPAPAAGKRPPRRARLRLTRIDPWSVMKTAFLLSVALGIVAVVSVFMVWSVLGAAGVWDSINSAVRDILGGESSDVFDIKDYVGTSRVLGFTMLVAVIDVVLLTAIATLGAFLYNMAAALLGGVEVTLAEDQ